MFRGARFIGFVFSLVLTATIVSASFGQSGRGRQPAPPKPTPKPNLPATTVLGVPDGGKLVRQDLDGVTCRYVLRNGLTVIIRERHSAPLVTVNVSVKAGSINLSDEMAGMANLTHRMMLRGTAKRPGAAIEKEVARLGGSLSSQVTYDQTSFNLVAPAESYQSMVELLADLIIRPAFNADDLKKASQAVRLDFKSEQDKTVPAAIEKLFATAFTANRVKRGSAISETLLAQVTREQVLAFYQHFYHPANTVVTIVGDIFTLQALGQVQLNFGSFARAGASAAKAPARGTAQPEQPAATQVAIEPFAPNPEEPAQDKLRYANSRGDMGHSLVTIGYRLPSFKPDKEGIREMATFQAMAAILGLGRGSRLSQGLREGLASRDKASVAIDTSAELKFLPGASMLIVQLGVDSDRIDRAEAEFFREVERFRREIVSEGEWQRARVMLEKRQVDLSSEIESEAALLARYQLQFGDYRLLDSTLLRLRAVTAQEIQQAAAKYLTLENVTVHEAEPRKAQARTFTPDKFAELVITFAAGATQPIKPEEVKPALAFKTFAQGAERGMVNQGQNIIVAAAPLAIKDFSVLRGPRAYVREDKSLPRLSVSVLFQGGRLLEDQTTSGLTELMLRSMLKSTTSRKADLIALELESYGGEIRVVNEADYFGYTLDVLSRNAESAVRLLLDLIENPFFDKDEVARERNFLIARQSERRDEIEAQAAELMWASIYPNHPYGLPRYGLAEALRTVNEERLEAWHKSTIRKQMPLVILVGDTDGSSLVSRIFSEGLKRNELDKAIKVNLPTTLAPPQERVEQRERQTTAQAIGFRVFESTVGGPTDLYALEMIRQLVASAKPAEELQSLTDQITVATEQRLASGGFFARISTLPENEERARELLLQELQRLATTPPTDDEFELARNSAIGRYAIALQSHPDRSLEYARAVIFSRKPSDVETQPDFIRAVKKSDLKRVAEATFKPNQRGLGVVRGNRQD